MPILACPECHTVTIPGRPVPAIDREELGWCSRCGTALHELHGDSLGIEAHVWDALYKALERPGEAA